MSGWVVAGAARGESVMLKTRHPTCFDGAIAGGLLGIRLGGVEPEDVLRVLNIVAPRLALDYWQAEQAE